MTCYIAGKTAVEGRKRQLWMPWNETHRPYGGGDSVSHHLNQLHTSLLDSWVTRHHHRLRRPLTTMMISQAAPLLSSSYPCQSSCSIHLRRRLLLHPRCPSYCPYRPADQQSQKYYCYPFLSKFVSVDHSSPWLP